MIRDRIIKDCLKSLKSLDFSEATIEVGYPAREEYGDYSSNIAMVLAKQYKKNPVELARKIVDAYPRAEYLAKIDVVEPGFINFWLSEDYFGKQLEEVLKEEKKFGSSSILKGKRIMVEFAHPNTHKLFHIGHLRNISLGEAIVRLLESQEAKVIRANYQGDVGLHIAKCLWAVLKTAEGELKTLDQKIAFLGRCYAEGSKVYDEDKQAQEKIKDINYLIYASAQKFQQKNGVTLGSTDYLKFVQGRAMETNKIYDFWRRTRQWSLDYFQRIYKRLGTFYDRYYFESECLVGVDIAREAVKSGILKESEGAIIFDGKNYDLDTRVFVNSLGLPTYEAKELALAGKEFSEFGDLDRLIHVVGPEQSSFFKVTFKVEELIDPKRYRSKQYHLIYGWVRLKHGKMASRTGQVVLAEWLLDEVKTRLKKTFNLSDEIAEIVAVGAVKYSLLKFSPMSEIVFDIDESINLEGDSGPYLQYTYARCQSVLKKSGGNYNDVLPARGGAGLPSEASKGGRLPCFNSSPSSERRGILEARNKGVIMPKTISKEELAICRFLYRFPEVVADGAKAYSPSLVCQYLFDLAKKYNLFYNQLSILKAGDEGTRRFRLLLTAATARVIKNGLWLLGIETLEKM